LRKKKLLYEKAAGKILVKLTPTANFEGDFFPIVLYLLSVMTSLSSTISCWNGKLNLLEVSLINIKV
jgi:hypothetical protein